VLEKTDNDCLAEGGRLYRNALGAYEEVAKAAVEGDPKEADAALDRTTPAEVRLARKLSACGFSQGKIAEAQAELARVDVAILHLIDQIGTCKVESCVDGVARHLESSSRDGVKAIDSMSAQIPLTAPSCLEDSLDLARQSYFALGVLAKAIQNRNVKVAERQGARADELGTQSQESLAACLSSALAGGAG
jgi:hypothetical protein